MGASLAALLGDGWTAHTLRHRAGTDFYGRTHDVLAVGRLLGHARPETSAVYIRVPDELLRSAVQ